VTCPERAAVGAAAARADASEADLQRKSAVGASKLRIRTIPRAGPRTLSVRTRIIHPPAVGLRGLVRRPRRLHVDGATLGVEAL
jgi:hypothetical protein